MHKRIVITGIAPLCSIGEGKTVVWDSILNGKTNIRKQEHYLDAESWGSYYIHKIDNFSLDKYNLSKDILYYIESWKKGVSVLDLYYLFAVIALAIKDSCLDLKDNQSKVGLIIAHENLCLTPFLLKVCQFSFDLLKNDCAISKKAYFQSVYQECERAGYDAQSFVSLYQIAKLFNIHNFSLFINNACASGLYAMEVARQMIMCGQNDVVMIAASDHPDIYKYLWFKDLNLYSSDGKIRPFSKSANGLVFGEGGAAIVMESLESAERRKAKIYAEYLGGGFHLEGWKVTAPDVTGDSLVSSIKQALENANVDENEINLIGTHGVGSKVVDFYEAKAINAVFNKGGDVLFTAFKPYVGHTLGASSLLEMVFLIMALENNMVPATLNCEDTNNYQGILLNKSNKQKMLKTVLKVCCAFAGYNAAAILRKL